MKYSEMVIKSNRPEGSIIPITLGAHNFKETDAPRHNSASGYGAKIPTRYMVRVGNYWRRVYCACWSNVGTLYIMRKGQKLVVDFY